MPAHVSLLEEGRGSVDGHADEETARRQGQKFQ